MDMQLPYYFGLNIDLLGYFCASPDEQSFVYYQKIKTFWQ